MHLTRFSKESGELAVRSVYSSEGVVVFCSLALKAESAADLEILARCAESGAVPEVVERALLTVSEAVAKEVGELGKRGQTVGHGSL